MKAFLPSIEPLEDRIAPAATLTGQVLSYTDIDGDHVKITISKGTLSLGMFSFVGIGTHESLQEIDLSSVPNLTGANITVSVVKAAGGDGLAAIGLIDAGTSNLGAVSIPGDLGAIECGSGAAGVTALKSLTVNTLGRYGLNTQGGTGTLESDIAGSLGSLTVHGDVTDAAVRAQGVNGTIGSVTIGGSLVGGSSGVSGLISSLGKMGAVRIGGSVLGGDGSLSGGISSQAALASLTIGGSLIGSGLSSAQIFAGGNLGPVRIGGDMVGGSEAYSGYIDCFGKITSVSVGGSVIGGGGVNTGEIAANRDIGPVKIGHNLQAGPINYAGGLGFVLPSGGNEAGKIAAGQGGVSGGIASITIAGSLIGGYGNDDTFTDANNVVHAGQIFALGNIGPVIVGGNVQGGLGDYSGSIGSAANIASISVAGSLIGGAGIDGAQLSASGTLTSVKIGRDIEVGAGADATSANITGGGNIALIQVGGSLVGGSISAFKSVGTIKIAGDLLGLSKPATGIITVSKTLGSISIGGSVIGGSDNDTGFINAGSIGAVAIGHDLVGGSISGTASDLVSSGFIASGARIGTVLIGGSVLAGTDSSTGGSLVQNASIRAEDDIGSLTVRGSVMGTVGSGGDVTPVIFSAWMPANPMNKLSFGAVKIGGNAQRMNIEAGYDTGLVPKDGNAQIGTVTIAGNFVASNLIAGVINYGVNQTNDGGTGDDNINFGDGNDHIIGGIVEGTPVSFSDTDHFGIVAHSITSLRVDGIVIPVPAASASVDLSNFTGDDVSAVTV